MSNISRRSFLQKGTAAAAALTIVPSAVLGKTHGHIAPTDKLNIAGVGCGRFDGRSAGFGKICATLCFYGLHERKDARRLLAYSV